MGEVQQQLRQGNIGGDQLTSMAKQGWSEFADDLPHQYRQELGQVMTELASRIQYVCSGQVPRTQTKYSALDGSSLAQHAQRTVHRVAQELPIDKRDTLEIVHEMSHRIEHVSTGSPTTWSNGEFEGQSSGKSRKTTFA